MEHWTTADGGITQVFAVRNPSEPADGKQRTVVVVIPGNPGIAEFYAPFCEALYNNAALEVDVICIAYPGHSHTDHISSTGAAGATHSIVQSWNSVLGQSTASSHKASSNYIKTSNSPLSLTDQIAHKVAILDLIISCYPTGTRFALCGHSIGGYMALNLLRMRPDVNIVKAIFLFPTLKYIADTANGRVVKNLVMPGVRHAIAFLLLVLRPILTVIPAVFYSIVALFTGMTGEHLKTTCEKLLHSSSGFHATTLAYYEMLEVKELDTETIAKNHDKLTFYYGPTDRWADASHYYDLKLRFPDIHAFLCDDGITHDFVINYSETMARKVVQWIY
ncbi:hypothetical protein HK100_011571 [Physocladia obscura]|uniref:Lipid droplet-associated hydrolase n=1 Tax=Physocladia obscura TaxID=109957 RepID=A0AAD5XE29_9FUNG|nr:hypothetical protein HK100_011571 [Physocladia obscura]